MSNLNFKLSEMVAVMAALDPVSLAAGTYTSAYVSAAKLHGFAGLVQVGAGGGTVTVSLMQATDTSGTGAKAITGKTTTGAVTPAVQYTVEGRPTDLDATNGFTAVALRIVVAGTATVAGGTLLGINTAYLPASVLNAASVAQQV